MSPRAWSRPGGRPCLVTTTSQDAPVLAMTRDRWLFYARLHFQTSHGDVSAMRLGKILSGLTVAGALALMTAGISTVSASGGAFTISWSPTSPTTSADVVLTTEISGCGTGNTSLPSLYYWASDGPSTYNNYYTNTQLTNGGDTAQASVDLGPLPAGTYTVYAYGRGIPCFGSSYNFTYTATSYMTVGASGPSTPTDVTASTNANGTVGLSWSPSTDGAGTVTSYDVTSSPSCSSCAGLTVSGNPAASSTTVSGLTLGTAYDFTVVATDSNGAHSSSSLASNSVVPATVPGRPGNVSADGGLGSATITWAAAAANGSAVSAYLVTASPGGASCRWSSGPLQCQISGLSNGRSYTFTVVATNAVGLGPASSPSAPVTPNQAALTVSQDRVGSREATVAGTGLMPGSTVTISLHSAVPINLATVIVGQSGSFVQTVSFPANTPAGAHTVLAVGTSPAGVMVSGSLAVTVSNTVAVPATGASLLTVQNLGASVVLMSLGLGMVALGIRRRRLEISSAGSAIDSSI